MPAAEQGGIRIRAASPDDAAELLEIYAPYVRETAISFEYEVPALDEFRARITATLARYPYLAAERGGALLGYAYCGAFSGRAAYALSAETSIYVRRDLDIRPPRRARPRNRAKALRSAFRRREGAEPPQPLRRRGIPGRRGRISDLRQHTLPRAHGLQNRRRIPQLRLQIRALVQRRPS